ncbi:hypothetical protein CTAYLR_003128 [Chrysophaeum taylorii]|uniref:Mic1 domain-containing protein n=1 Tax=Chrysophaeum taylorii TaxID=2483200 RepID=A0AAD7UNG4_9STRA|nr:hypothetical protein CTAYLR_003128 [Chrysophaeum taylorii]
MSSSDEDVSSSSLDKQHKRNLVSIRSLGVSAKNAWYDETHEAVVSLRGDVASSGDRRATVPPTSRLVRFSLDGSLFGAHVGEASLVVGETTGSQQQRWRIEAKQTTSLTPSLLRDTGLTTVFGPKDDDLHAARILGFVWSDHGGSSQDLVIVTTRGVEFYKVAASRSQCRHVRSLTYNTRTYWYLPSHRLLMLATSSLGAEVRGYWLRTQVSDLPKFELPPPEKIRKLDLPASRYVEAAPVDRDDAALAVLYAQVYLVYAHRRELQVLFYAVAKDKCVLAKSVKLSPRCGATDAVLCRDDNLVYFWTPRMLQVLDVAATQPLVVAATAVDRVPGTARPGTTSGGAAVFFSRDEGRWVGVAINLSYVAQHLNDDPRRLVSFLLRRGHDDKELARHAFDLVAATAVELMADDDLEDLADLFDLVAADQLSQRLMIKRVFDHATDVDDRTLADALVAYLAALHRRRVPVSPSLSDKLARLLVTLNANDELAHFIHFKVLPDSPQLCDLLLAQPDQPRLHRLAFDALHRLGHHAKLAKILLEMGFFEEGLRVAATHETPLAPTDLLDLLPAASSSSSNNNNNNNNNDRDARRALLDAWKLLPSLDPDHLARLVIVADDGDQDTSFSKKEEEELKVDPWTDAVVNTPAPLAG